MWMVWPALDEVQLAEQHIHLLLEGTAENAKHDADEACSVAAHSAA